MTDTSSDIEYSVDDEIIDNIFQQDYLKPSEVSQLFNVSDSSIRKYIREGVLKALKVGGTYRIKRRDVIRFIERNQDRYGKDEL